MILGPIAKNTLHLTFVDLLKHSRKYAKTMEEKKYVLRYVHGNGIIGYIDYIGTSYECINIMNARCQGCWAIMPYEE